MKPVIECRNVRKSFLLEEGGSSWRLILNLPGGKYFHALTNVTIDVPKGEFVGLLGRNGAGKSTLLRTIGGVYAADSGVTYINGDMSALYEMGLTGNEHLTGRGFTRRWFEIFSRYGDKLAPLIEDVHEFSELLEAFDRPIRTYSAGMKARLFFALATARKSDVYIIDELLSVGDEYFQNKCWRRIRQRLGGGAGGIIATHDWGAILRLCPTSYILERGCTVSYGSSQRVVRDYLGLAVDGFSEGAKFDPEPPKRIDVRSLENFVFEVGVNATQQIGLVFGAAVEVFVPGYGWEHVLHAQPEAIGMGPGRLLVKLEVPKLPLKRGVYSLGLFLSRDDAGGRRSALDVRSWTYDEGVYLNVDGDESAGAIRWPLSLVDETDKGLTR